MFVFVFVCLCLRVSVSIFMCVCVDVQEHIGVCAHVCVYIHDPPSTNHSCGMAMSGGTAEENPSSLTEEQSLILAERVQEQTSLFDEDDFQVPPRTTRSQASSTARILGTSSSLSDPPTTRNTRGKVFQEKTISQAKEEPDVHCSENSCEEEDADLCGAVPATPSKPPTEEIK